MHKRDYRDLIAGGLIIALGLFVAIYATQHFRLGTISHIGPGMFPAILGYILAGIGLMIFVVALFRAGDWPKPDVGPFVIILLAIFGFAVTANWFGMVPAVIVLVVVAVLADGRLSIPGTLALAVVLSLIAVLIFRIGLKVPMPIVKWPF